MNKSTNHFNNPLVESDLGGVRLTRLRLSQRRLRCRGKCTMQDDLCKTETHIHTHCHHTVTDSWTCIHHHDSRGQKFGISLQGGELRAYPGKAAFPWGEGIPLPLFQSLASSFIFPTFHFPTPFPFLSSSPVWISLPACPSFPLSIPPPHPAALAIPNKALSVCQRPPRARWLPAKNKSWRRLSESCHQERGKWD